MSSETRSCQNCKNQFTIEPEDFDFYAKIKVPAPTFCPECRLQRRLAWRNERYLYRTKCGATGKDILSIYPPKRGLIVYDQKYWWSDAWDPTSYGREYDFSTPFFVQFAALLKTCPLINVFNANSIDSDYCNYVVNHKNCYLVSAGWDNEDVVYSNRVSFCKDSADLYVCHKNEGCYGNIYCKESYRLFFSISCESCNESAFLYDCRNCQSCFGCVNLRNKSYCIFNKQYSKEEYLEKIKDLSLTNYSTIQSARIEFEKLYNAAIHRYARVIKCQDVIGDNIEASKNCYYCFDVAGGAENSKYCHWATYGMKDCYDFGPGAGGKSELIYEGVSSGVNNAQLAFTGVVWNSHNLQYCFNCHGCKDCFGCVSLKNKQYCIFNRQYSKEEYEKLRSRIIEHMSQMPYIDHGGRIYKYGEYLPPELSGFAYNESVAQEYFPLDKESASKDGYLWGEPISRNYQATISSSALPDSLSEIDNQVTTQIIKCAHSRSCDDGCSEVYRIIPQEFDFYKKLNIAPPRLCYNCRHYQRFRQRNPLKLWHRQCMCDKQHPQHSGRCPNEFETSYAPDRKEIVYCEQCYNAEVV